MNHKELVYRLRLAYRIFRSTLEKVIAVLGVTTSFVALLVVILILLLFTQNLTAQKFDRDQYLVINAQYVVFTSSEEERSAADHTFEQDPGNRNYHMFMLMLFNVNRMMTFFSYDNVPPIMKPKSFLDSIEYMDWDVYSADPTLTKEKADKMIEEFRMTSLKGGLIYFIDRRDFTTDSIQVIGVRMAALTY